MAILSGGPNSGFSGKVGSVVGYLQHGKWIIRGLPKLSRKNKKGSKDQNVCRSKFSKMQYFLKPIIPFIRVGFNLEARRNNNTAHNSAKSWNMLNAFDENGEINYEAFRFSIGSLPGASEATVTLVNDELVFTWRDNSAEGSSKGVGDNREDDQVMILAYDLQTNRLEGTFSGARRSTGRHVIKVLHEKLPSDYHTWISFISDDRQSIADSTYTGVVTF